MARRAGEGGEMRESVVKVAVRLGFGQAEGFVIWVNSTGLAELAGHTFRFGLCNGSSDCIGLAPGGLFLAVEVKGDGGRATDEQLRFLELVHERGGVACLLGPSDTYMDGKRLKLKPGIIDDIRAGKRRFGF
jgi:hypothetical protein